MNVEVRLLGAPSVETSGASTPAPRARKTWALLAYLLLAERPQTRQRLASLFFPEAQDPLGALRWSLADLRRSLRPHVQLGGDPVRLTLAADVTSDLQQVLAGSARPVPTGELLEGMSFDGLPELETWLLVERRRLAGACEALLHEDALRNLGAGLMEQAVQSSSRLVAMNPLDENNQALFVRALTAAGQREAALEQVARCERLFQRKLAVLHAMDERFELLEGFFEGEGIAGSGRRGILGHRGAGRTPGFRT